ncbi:hypothetical protein [Aeromicrobium sp. Leaf291]|uniref:hypothetical protein n=1 Tax=Aeromicrobium sp. Leaf291 TaxID=1736325 RepID=UPI0006FBEB71|nr:hypothetical protein [Aeromicrobium sp. Leaf291]KQP81601.1 hypothetical protein ASF35_16350 [Aeromicrobium sp. Leaf291]
MSAAGLVLELGELPFSCDQTRVGFNPRRPRVSWRVGDRTVRAIAVGIDVVALEVQDGDALRSRTLWSGHGVARLAAEVDELLEPARPPRST